MKVLKAVDHTDEELRANTLSIVVLELLLLPPGTLSLVAVPGSAVPVRPGPLSPAVSTYETQGIVTFPDSLPEPSDLRFNNDTLPVPLLRSLAANLSYSPLKEFLYVRDTVYFDPYYGSMKGALQTFADAAGNDVDQASLLVALLRLSGIPARYVQGNMTLSSQELANWEGFSVGTGHMNKTEVLETRNLLYYSGIPYRDRFTNSSWDSDRLTISHMMVEAYINRSWAQMDPSFKMYYSYAPIDWANVIKINPKSLYGANAITGEGLYKDVSSGLLGYASQNPGAAVGNLLSSKMILNATTYSMPLQWVRTESKSSLTNSLRWFLQVSFPNYDSGTNSFSFSPGYAVNVATSLAGIVPPFIYGLPDPQTLQYIESFPQGIFDPSIDISRVKMRPALSLNSTFLMAGDLVPAGTSMPIAEKVYLGTNQFGAGSTNYNVGASASLAVGVGHDWSPKDPLLGSSTAQYGKTLATYSVGQQVGIGSLFGEKFFYAARLYFRDLSEFAIPVERSLNLVSVEHVTVGLLGFDLQIGTRNGAPAAFFGGEHIDLEIGGRGYPFQFDNQTKRSTWFNFLSGYMASYFEGTTMQATTWTSPISTISVLLAAQEEGLRLVTIAPSNTSLVAELDIPTSIKSKVQDRLNQGWYVTIPNGLVNTTSLKIGASAAPVSLQQASTFAGTGFIAFHPDGWDAWYLLYGVGISLTGTPAIEFAAGGGSGTDGPMTSLYDGMSSWLNTLFTDPTNRQMTTAAVCGVRGSPNGSPALSTSACQGFPDEQACINTVNFVNSEIAKAQSVPERAIKTVFGGLGAVTGATVGLGAGIGYLEAGVAAAAIGGAAGLVAGVAIGYGVYWALHYSTTSSPIQNGPTAVLAVRGIPPLASTASVNQGVNLYITDGVGLKSGYTPSSAQADPSAMFYSGAGTSQQQVWLFEPASGTYTVSIVNQNATTVTMYGSLSWSTSRPYPVPSQKGNIPFGPVSIPPGATVSAVLKVSHSGGTDQFVLGRFGPASFTKVSVAGSVILGKAATVRGNVTGEDGVAPISGESVTLLLRTAGDLSSGWASLESATTDSTGSFMLSWTPSDLTTVDLLAEFPGGGGVRGSNGSAVEVVTTWLNVTAATRGPHPVPLRGVGVTAVSRGAVAYSETTDAGGTSAFLLPGGGYLVAVPGVINATSTSRFAFAQWSDGSLASTKDVLLTGKTGLTSVFKLQFSVQVSASPPEGGAVTGPGPWSDANSTVQLGAVSAQGWKFVGWSGQGNGSFTGSSASASFKVGGAVAEVAVFYPGLGLASGSGGTVTYASGPANGTVQSSGTETVYVPPGTSVSLMAHSAQGYSFAGWQGSGSNGYTGESPSVTIAVSRPTTEAATFKAQTSTTSTTPTASGTTTATTTTTAATSSTSTSGGGIPEFSFGIVETAILALVIILSYLMVARRRAPVSAWITQVCC